MTEPVRLGLIGLGKQGREHLEAVSSCTLARIEAGADPDLDARKVCEERYALRCHDHYQDLLAAGGLDGLILALPHHDYAKIWPVVERAGLPVLKEKPLGRTLREALTFMNLGARPGCHVRTAIQRRTHPSYAFLKSRLDGQKLRAVEAVLHLGHDPERPPHKWRARPDQAGGGALLDSGYHAIDLVIFLAGPVEVVSAQLWANGKPAAPEMLETEASLLGRAGPAWVRVESKVGGECSGNGYRKAEWVRVETADAVYCADRETVSRNGEKLFDCSGDWRRAQARQLDDFAAAIRSGAADEPAVWDQGPVMRVIENAYALARQIGPFRGGFDHG